MLLIERRRFNFIVLSGVTAISIVAVAYQAYVCLLVNRLLSLCMLSVSLLK
jgi:hypothetical protein